MGRDMQGVGYWKRFGWLNGIALLLMLVLQVRVMILIVAEYPNYFPANFDSAFLIGRRSFFAGSYRAAFYVHIIAGPLALILGGVLLWSGLFTGLGSSMHRLLGRVQSAVVLLAVIPSSVIMSTRAYSGVVAGLGFAALSCVTALCMIISIQHAQARRVPQHQAWALRCYVLLCSPLLMRLMSGAVITMRVESELTYQVCAWASWLVPWAVLEFMIQYNSCVGLNRQRLLLSVDRGARNAIHN